MRRTIVTVLALAGLAACGRGNETAALGDSAARNLSLVPNSSGGAINDRPVSTAPATRTLGTGSRIDATWGSAITSRSNKAGETVTISVGSDVQDKNGRVVIPAGSTVDLLITQLAPATNKNQQWCKTPVDAFLLQKMEAAGMQASLDAPKAAQLRSDTDLRLADSSVIESVDEYGDQVSVQILTMFPNMVLQQVRNTIAVSSRPASPTEAKSFPTIRCTSTSTSASRRWRAACTSICRRRT